MPGTKALRPTTFKQVSRVVVPRAPTYFVSIRSHGNAERPCESEIGQLEIVIFVDEEVLRFEVSV